MYCIRKTSTATRPGARRQARLRPAPLPPLSFTRRKRLRHSDACNFAFGNPARFREFVGLFKALQAKRVTIVWLRPNATAELEQIVATPAAATPAQTLACAPHFHSFWISAGRIGWRLFPSHRTSFTFSTKGTSR